MNLIAKIFSTFFGAGLFPVVPGTFASAAAALLHHYFLRSWKPLPYAFLVLGLTVLGVAAAGRYAKFLNKKDPRPIVIDEVAGQLISLFLAPAGWGWTAAGFLLFRLLDIVKPYPICRTERWRWGWGIMADDIVAGAGVAILIHSYLWLR